MSNQPDAPDLLTLRPHLVSLLTPYLGQLSNGALGLWVETPRNSSALSGKGVICVIERDKQPGSTRAAGPQTSRTFYWQVTLTNYGTSSGDRTGKTAVQIEQLEAEYDQKMDEALEAMRSKFPVSRERISPQSKDTYRRSTFLLQYNELLNPRI